MTNGRNEMMVVGLSFVTGCVVGGIAGLLYAPQSGARTRRQLAGFAEDVRERAGEATEQATHTIQKAVERGRTLVNA
ncbi:MAG: YtxH domain-containing protein [Nitrospira sp.]|nr:YtxH domain-containing protein [Nitrospira sp.]MDH4327978.1 YtxH domain-containing protein [Nitrospira sp.]MDH5251970.1 YtxH domain-containing protein [Nitrospira sp.]